jgi:hypothetical protein
VVPSFSSLLGDPREHGETLQANHMDMCRFSHAHDPNYRKVGGELQSIYRSIVAEASIGHKPELASRTNDRELTEDERGIAFLSEKIEVVLILEASLPSVLVLFGGRNKVSNYR